ncbi:MAG: ATP-binding cassette domain-containing protein [Actinomycetota bacterium]
MQQGSGTAWEEHRGEMVTVHAAPGGEAAAGAERELQRAEEAARALTDLLEVSADLRARRVAIYLVDPVPPSPGGPEGMPPDPSAMVGESGIVRVSQDGPGDEPIAWAVTRYLSRSWFGAGAAEASPFVDGLAGVIAAGTGTGPSVESAHTWVRDQLNAGKSVSVLAGTSGLGPGGGAPGEPPGAGPPAEGPPAGGPPGAAPPVGGPPPEGPPGGPEGAPPPGDAVIAPPPGAMMMKPGGPGPGAAAPSTPPAAAAAFAATSFVGSLLERHGGAAIRRVLEGFDPARRDRIVVEVFQQSLGSLEENWLKSLRAQPKAQTLRTFIQYMLPLFRPYWLRQIEVFVYMIIAAVFAVISLPLASGAVIGALSPNSESGHGQSGPLGSILANVTDWLRRGNTQSKIFVFAGILLLVYGLQALISLRRWVASETVSQRLVISLQERLFGHLLRLPHSFYSQANVGDLMSRLTSDIMGVSTALTGILNHGMFLTISVATAAASVVTLNPRLGAMILVVAPLFFLTYKVLSGRIAKASYERMVQMGSAASVTEETLSAHSVIKAFGLEKRAQAAYAHQLGGIFKSALRMVRIQSIFEASSEIFITLGELLVLSYGGYLVLHGDLALAVLVAFVGIVPSLLLPIAGFSDIGEMVQTASGSLARVTELLDQPLPISDPPGAKPAPPLERELKFENVTFGYTPDKAILQDVDITIRSGENVAIVGASGSGKSTLVNLLLRFWDPWSGQVLFDGRDIREATLESVRGQIGMVFQETFAFNTTIRENIAIGRPDASDEEITGAARGAQIDEWIEQLPAGYETVLGERGVRMSGGQRQRLAIARVLLRNPRIMVLDEATSALDAETEAEILDTLQEVARGRTTLAITHRLSMAARADRVLVIDKGRVAEEGTHSELVAAGGLYQRLYESQVASATALGAPATPAAAASEAPVALAEGLDIDQLREVPLLSGLSEAEVEAVARHLRPERRTEGEVVVRQGDRGDSMYLVGSGELEVVVEDEGVPRHVGLLHGGDHFGEVALLTGKPRNATVRTTMPSELYSLSRADFEELLRQQPQVRDTLTRVMTERSSALAAAAEAAGATRP